jgi:hypothetical protein
MGMRRGREGDMVNEMRGRQRREMGREQHRSGREKEEVRWSKTGGMKSD